MENRKELVYLDDFGLDDTQIAFIIAFHGIVTNPNVKTDEKTVERIRDLYLKPILPSDVFEMVQAYSTDRVYRTHTEEEVKNIKTILLSECGRDAEWLFIDDENHSNYCCGIYNLLLMQYRLNELIDCELGIVLDNDDIDTIDENMLQTMDNIGHVCNGVSSFFIDMAILTETFDYQKHYMPAPGLAGTFKRNRLFQKSKKELYDYFATASTKQYICAGDIKILFLLEKARKECSLSKLSISLLYIIMGQQYPVMIRRLSYRMADLLCEATLLGQVHRVIIKTAPFNSETPLEKRGKNDHTTQISIVFSTPDYSVYFMRIDLPHGNEREFHINLQEPQNEFFEDFKDTGFPMIQGEFEQIFANCVLSAEEKKQLFFERNGVWWFRPHFLEELNQINMAEDKRKSVEQVFTRRCHKDFGINVDEDTANAFVQLWKKYIGALEINNVEYFQTDTETVAFSKTFNRIVKYYQAEDILNRSGDYEPVIVDNFFRELFDHLELDTEKMNNGHVYDRWEKMREFL